MEIPSDSCSPGPGPPSLASRQVPFAVAHPNLRHSTTTPGKEFEIASKASDKEDPLSNWKIWHEIFGDEPQIPAIAAQSPFIA